MTEGLRGLSVCAPWWWWIIYGGKNIENRSQRTHYRGPLLIQASTRWGGARVARDNETAISSFMKAPAPVGIVHPGMDFDQIKALGGHIVGVVDVVDCLDPSPNPENPWQMPGQFGWVLSNARPVKTPVKFPGALGLFRTPYEVNGGGSLVVR